MNSYVLENLNDRWQQLEHSFWKISFLTDRQEYLYKIAKEIYNYLTVTYSSDSSYSIQMEIYFSWKSLQSQLEEEKCKESRKVLNWFIREIHQMFESENDEIKESIWYAIGVNYFECGNDGYWLFKDLFNLSNQKAKEQLLQYSISISWEGKVETYQMIAQKYHDFHQQLADALLNSCHAYCYESLKPWEALEILNTLKISDNKYQLVFKEICTPKKVTIKRIIETKGDLKNEIKCFLQFDKNGIMPTWYPYAELWIDNKKIVNCPSDYHKLTWKEIIKEYNLEEEESDSRNDIIPIYVNYNEEWLEQIVEIRPLLKKQL